MKDYKQILKELCMDTKNPDLIRDINCVLPAVCIQELREFCKKKQDETIHNLRTSGIAAFIASIALDEFGEMEDKGQEIYDYILWFVGKTYEKMQQEYEKKKFHICDDPFLLFPALERELYGKNCNAAEDFYLERIGKIREEMRI